MLKRMFPVQARQPVNDTFGGHFSQVMRPVFRDIQAAIGTHCDIGGMEQHGGSSRSTIAPVIRCGLPTGPIFQRSGTGRGGDDPIGGYSAYSVLLGIGQVQAAVGTNIHTAYPRKVRLPGRNPVPVKAEFPGPGKGRNDPIGSNLSDDVIVGVENINGPIVRHSNSFRPVQGGQHRRTAIPGISPVPRTCHKFKFSIRIDLKNSVVVGIRNINDTLSGNIHIINGHAFITTTSIRKFKNCLQAAIRGFAHNFGRYYTTRR